MANILFYFDPHISPSSSIIRGRGERLPERLESIIYSFQWLNKLALDNNCIAKICGGDLFDASTLTPDILTALPDCHLDDHIMVVGNHDMYSADGFINAAGLYGTAVYEPTIIYSDNNCTILALPYSSNLLDLNEYVRVNGYDPDKLVIVSHNDIKGLYYGNYMNNHGYEIPDILRCCRLYLNGHIHTGKWLVKDRVINCGTFTGLNFNCKDSEWDPGAFILDTETFKLTYYKNPYGYVFKQLEFNDARSLNDYFRNLDNKRYCIQVKVPTDLVESTREWINKLCQIKYSRIISIPDNTEKSDKSEDLAEDLHDKFNHNGTSIYSMLLKYIDENLDQNKYDKNIITKEISYLENI